MELELVKKEKKGLKTYLISWVKNYYATGTVEIEAPTKEEAIQIAEDNLSSYDGSGSLDGDTKNNYSESCWEVEE